MVSVRKSLAGALIRLAHRIDRPAIAVDHGINFHGPINVGDLDELLKRQNEAARFESRGWN